MISVIICSHKKNVLEKAKLDIAATIGVAHEFIVIENPSGSFGICEAYNRGAAKSAYDILCFVHEDVSFETKNWGQAVVKHLASKETGLIGLAGGDSKSMVPSSWPSYISENEMSLIQHYKNNDIPGKRFFSTGNKSGDLRPARVACIDGVWMCTRKDVFAKYQFDAVNFKKFHGYDIDYALQVNQSYHVYVVFDVLLHHYSDGSFNREWLTENILLSKKWKHQLPFSVKSPPKQELIRQHWTCMNIFIDQMIELKCSTPYIVSLFLGFAFNHLFHFRHFLYSGRLILQKQILKQH